MLQPVDKNDVVLAPKDTKPKLKCATSKLKDVIPISENVGLKSKVVEEKNVMLICKRAEMGMPDNCALCQIQLSEIYKYCTIKYSGF